MSVFPAYVSNHMHVVPMEARRDSGSPGTGITIGVESSKRPLNYWTTSPSQFYLLYRIQ